MKTFAVRLEMIGNAVPSEVFPSLNAGYDDVHKGLFLMDAESMDDIYRHHEHDERVRSIEVLGEVENVQDYRMPGVFAVPGLDKHVKPTEKLRLLAHAANRAGTDRMFMGYWLQRFQREQDLSEQVLSEFLACPSFEKYYLLWLVTAVYPDDVDYGEQLHKISAYIGCDVQKLNEVLTYFKK